MRDIKISFKCDTGYRAFNPDKKGFSRFIYREVSDHYILIKASDSSDTPILRSVLNVIDNELTEKRVGILKILFKENLESCIS